MELPPHQEDALQRVTAAFASGATRVRLRQVGGKGAADVAAAFLATRKGLRMALCPVPVVAQTVETLRRHGVEQGTDMVVDTYGRAATAPVGTCDWIVADEDYPEMAERDRRVIEGFGEGARILEISRMPSSFPGILDRVDVEIEFPRPISSGA